MSPGAYAGCRKIQERYGGQFHGHFARLHVLCDCGLHFTQLRIDAELAPGKDTCFLAMTAAWNRTPALVPELQYKDLVIPRPVPIPAVEEEVPKEEPQQTATPKVQQKKMPKPAQRLQTKKGETGPF